MKRVLFWLLIAGLCWEVFVYWNSQRRSRTAPCAPTVKQSTEPLPSADDVIDAIRYFLKNRNWRVS